MPSRRWPASLSSASAMRSRARPVASNSWSMLSGRSATKRMLSSTVRTRSGDMRFDCAWIFENGVSGSSSAASISAGATSSSSSSCWGGAVTAAISASLMVPLTAGFGASSSGTSGSLVLIADLLWSFFDERGERIATRGDEQVSLVVALEHADQPQLAHLEHGQERDDHLRARAVPFEQRHEADAVAALQLLGELVN